MKKKLGVILMILFVFAITAGCSSPQEEGPEVVWDTLSVEEQGIDVTVTDTARDHMADDWEGKSSNTALFMLIPGSS